MQRPWLVLRMAGLEDAPYSATSMAAECSAPM